MAESKQSVCQCVNSAIDYIDASPYPLFHLIKPACQTHPKPSFTNGKDGHLVFPASPLPSILLSLCIRLTSPVTGAQVHFAYCVFIRQADDVKYDENIASGYGCRVTPHHTSLCALSLKKIPNKMSTGLIWRSCSFTYTGWKWKHWSVVRDETRNGWAGDTDDRGEAVKDRLSLDLVWRRGF